MGCLRHLPEFFTIHQTVDRRNPELRQKVTGCGANVVMVGGLVPAGVACVPGTAVYRVDTIANDWAYSHDKGCFVYTLHFQVTMS